MAKSDYVKNRSAEFSNQLTAFKLNIANYSTTLALTPAQVTAQAADADYFAFAVACQEISAQSAQQWTAWRDLIREGSTPPATKTRADGVPSARSRF